MKNYNGQQKQLGFTLIELMIVVAIVGILAAVAYPAYSASILKGKRAQGRTALTELMQQQERYMTQRNCYLGFTTDSAGAATVSTTCGGTVPTSVPFKTSSGDNLANSAYLMSAGLCPTSLGGTLSINDCVQVIATPTNANLDKAIGTITLTSTGNRSCTTPGGTAIASGTSAYLLCWP